VEGHERAEALAGVVVVDEVERCLNAAAGFGENLFLDKGDAGVEGFAEGVARTVERSNISRACKPRMLSRSIARKRRAIRRRGRRGRRR